jgi:hypothetical protein
MNVQTILPTAIPEGYFSDENVQFILDKIHAILMKEYDFVPKFVRGGIVRVMQKIIEDRLETIPKMNQRVIMTCCNDWRNYQQEANKHLNWEENYINSQKLFDPKARRGPDIYGIKSRAMYSGYYGGMNNKLMRKAVSQFYFT